MLPCAWHLAQAYVSYSNTSGSRPRPAVIVVPDYDGIGNYERWRADLLASMGYVGALAEFSRLPSVTADSTATKLDSCRFPSAAGCMVSCTPQEELSVTGFVADIYNNSVAQGPALPEANRSAAMAIYNSNLTLLHSRLLGALAAVRQLCSVMTGQPQAEHALGGVQLLACARSLGCFSLPRCCLVTWQVCVLAAHSQVCYLMKQRGDYVP